MAFSSDRLQGENLAGDYELIYTDLVEQLKPVSSLAREPTNTRDHYSKKLGPLLFDHLFEVANTTSTLIAPLVGAEYCAITIKLVWWDKGEAVVHTVMRDTQSYWLRGSYRPTDLFDVRNNTAFESLVYDSAPLYMSNNLRLEAAAKRYKNVNERWKEFYNSTAVVRITPPDNKETTIGFLCADRWAWQAQAQSEPVQEVLAKISDHVYNTLELLVPDDGHGQKRIGFRLQSDELVPVDERFQREFQKTLEAFRLSFDRNFYQRQAHEDARMSARSHFALPALAEESGMDDDETLQAMLASAAKTPRIRRLQEYVRTLTPQDIADRLKPIAKKNPYARQLLSRAKKRRLVK